MSEYTCGKCRMVRSAMVPRNDGEIYVGVVLCHLDKHEVDPDAECSMPAPICGPWCRQWYSQSPTLARACLLMDYTVAPLGEPCLVNPARVFGCLEEAAGERSE